LLKKIVFFASLILIDWLTKFTIKKYFFPGEIKKDFKKIFNLFDAVILNLVYVTEEKNSFFYSESIRPYSIVFAIFFLLFLILLIIDEPKKEQPKKEQKEQFLLVCCFAGLVGNIFEGLFSGSVVRFIEVELLFLGKTHYFPAFNVADIYFYIGLFGGLFIKHIFQKR
jgi:lipoprotein signal peptidase